MNINLTEAERQLVESAVTTFQANIHAFGHSSDSEKTHAELEAIIAKLQPQREITLLF